MKVKNERALRLHEALSRARLRTKLKTGRAEVKLGDKVFSLPIKKVKHLGGRKVKA